MRMCVCMRVHVEKNVLCTVQDKRTFLNISIFLILMCGSCSNLFSVFLSQNYIIGFILSM